MQAKDYVFEQIYKGALAAGAKERAAHSFAIIGMDRWAKNKFKKTSALVREMIQEALRYRA